MTDQADTLRLMAAAPHLHSQSANTQNAPTRNASAGARTIAVTSGKGGVGKSNFAVNVSLELAALGHTVSLLDADLALANADVLFGVTPSRHLGHVVAGECSLAEAVLEVADGVRLIPGGSGITELANLSSAQHAHLLSELRAMETSSDFMLVDTAAGIAGNVTGVLSAAHEIVVVTTPEPTSVVDAYATIKVMHKSSPGVPVWIVVNDVIGVGDAERTFTQLSSAASRFLGRRIDYLGAILRDDELVEAVRDQTPVVLHAPGAASSRSFRLIAKHMSRRHEKLSSPDPVKSFWESLVMEPV